MVDAGLHRQGHSVDRAVRPFARFVNPKFNSQLFQIKGTIRQRDPIVVAVRIKVIQFPVLVEIQRGQLIIAAVQRQQVSIFAEIQRGQLVAGTVQIRQCGIAGDIQRLQLVFGAVQRGQRREEFDAGQICDGLFRAIYGRYIRDFFGTERAFYVIGIKIFADIDAESRIREGFFIDCDVALRRQRGGGQQAQAQYQGQQYAEAPAAGFACVSCKFLRFFL